MAPPARFPIRFTGFNRAMALFGIAPSRCRVEVDEAQLHVSMGWAFEMRAPLADVRVATLDHDRVLGWGAHGWRGTWLVNGSSTGLVRIDSRPAGTRDDDRLLGGCARPPGVGRRPAEARGGACCSWGHEPRWRGTFVRRRRLITRTAPG